MSMSKQDFIALANVIKRRNEDVADGANGAPFDRYQIAALAAFCCGQNSRFIESRWLGYINGDNGPSGGAVKAKK